LLQAAAVAESRAANCPDDATPFELLADDAGLGPQELREYLRAEIERRRRPAAPVPSKHDERGTRSAEVAEGTEVGAAGAGPAERIGARDPAEEHAFRARRAAA
jgi:hypothetical protein